MRELVKTSKKDALILMTLYSPFMCAGHCATAPVLQRHLEEDPAAVKRGLDILTESQLIFVRACIKAGVDGFYMSTQGSEAKQFTNPKIFTDYVKPVRPRRHEGNQRGLPLQHPSRVRLRRALRQLRCRSRLPRTGRQLQHQTH